MMHAAHPTTFIGNYFEWHTDANDKVRYYYAGGQRIAMRQGNGVDISTLTYLLGDQLGSTSLTFKADTYATVTQLYSPWGGRKSHFRVRYSSGTLPTKYTYTGQYSYAGSGEFGLLFYVARWYDPVLGRFSSADTLVPGAGNPMAWDRYAGMMNNPVKYSDPSGHCVTMATTGPGGSCGAGGGGGSGPVYESGGGAIPNGFTLNGTGASAGSQMRGLIIRVGVNVGLGYAAAKISGNSYTPADAASAILFSVASGEASGLIANLIGKWKSGGAVQKYLMLIGAEAGANVILNSVQRRLSEEVNGPEQWTLDLAIGASTAIIGYQLDIENFPTDPKIFDLPSDGDWDLVFPTIQTSIFDDVLSQAADSADDKYEPK